MSFGYVPSWLYLPDPKMDFIIGNIYNQYFKYPSNQFSGPKMKSCVINGLKILLPSDNFENEDLDIDIQTHIFIPKNCSALQNRKPDNFPLFMYGMKDLNNRTLSSHYEKRLNKFYQRKVNCQMSQFTTLKKNLSSL